MREMETQDRVYCHSAYGLTIHSPLCLPELLQSEAAADVLLRWGKVQKLPSVIDETGVGFWSTGDEACHFVVGVGAFLIRNGYEVIVDPAPGVDECVLRLSLLGPVMSLLLHQRGQLVLHASAVEVAGRAVAFMGGRGWGKSTQAAILESRGHGIISDDLTAVNVKENGCTVIPGFPWLKLWPDTIASLGQTAEGTHQLHPLVDKRGRWATRQSSRKPLPLRRIYLLSKGAVPEIETCARQDALTEIMRHWKGAEFGEALLRTTNISAFFAKCATLVKNIAMYRLKRPASLSALPEVTDLVEDHLRREDTSS